MDSYTPDQIARIVHEANRALQHIQADPGIAVSPSWDDLDEETRESARSGVVAAQDGATPAESHEGWCDFKRAHGWTYGLVKDSDAKTHPCLVDYDELPDGQRDKDDLFVAIVNALG